MLNSLLDTNYGPFFNQGDFVWVDTGSGVPIGAEVKVTDTGQLQLIDDEGKVRHLYMFASLPPMNISFKPSE